MAICGTHSHPAAVPRNSMDQSAICELQMNHQTDNQQSKTIQQSKITQSTIQATKIKNQTSR
jgi:hypothetical protein